jgi:hypothetical protein
MFTTPTLFILGAGASWHYGYPTGADLIKRVIVQAHEFANLCAFSEHDSVNLPVYVKKRVHDLASSHPIYTRQAWLEVKQECLNIAERLKHINPLVIDYFLGHNKDLEEIGKILIAKVILSCESHFLKKKDNLNRDYSGGTNLSEHFRENDDWYRFLVEELVNDCGDIDDLVRNKFNVITFNYDVSLEQQLLSRLNSIDQFSGNSEQIESFLRKRIYHVYGAIREGFGRPEEIGIPEESFGLTFNEESLQAKQKRRRKIKEWDLAYEAAQKLSTIDPGDKNNGKRVPMHIQRVIDMAKEIYILGYGFDQNNSWRLYLNDLTGPMGKIDKHIHFTNYQDSNRVSKRVAMLFELEFDALIKSETWGNPRDGGYCEKSIRDVYKALELDFESFGNGLF